VKVLRRKAEAGKKKVIMASGTGLAAYSNRANIAHRNMKKWRHVADGIAVITKRRQLKSRRQAGGME
jgi:hypothetical protein